MVANTFRLSFVLFLLSAYTAEAAEHPKEMARKVNYLLQLTKFISWPKVISSHYSPIEFCIFATTPSQEVFQKLHLRKSQNRTIHMNYINQDHELSKCDIVFIHQFIPNDIVKKNYYALISNNILTIGENSNFAKEGGVIELNVTDKNVDIKINTKTATEANIAISANLIEIASTVITQGSLPR
jgi:hypothetical protein